MSSRYFLWPAPVTRQSISSHHFLWSAPVTRQSVSSHTFPLICSSHKTMSLWALTTSFNFHQFSRQLDQLPYGSTGTSSGNCQDSEICMARASHTPQQPLQNHPLGHLEGWTSLPMPELLTTASCRRDWKRISAESSPQVPPDAPISQGTQVNWVDSELFTTSLNFHQLLDKTNYASPHHFLGSTTITRTITRKTHELWPWPPPLICTSYWKSSRFSSDNRQTIRALTASHPRNVG